MSYAIHSPKKSEFLMSNLIAIGGGGFLMEAEKQSALFY
jgi:hypothetical protein